MSKEIIFKQNNPQMGKLRGVLRIVGRDLFIKVNSHQYSKQLIDRFKSAGASVEESRNWIKVDLFKIQPNIILGGVTLDVEEENDEQIEKKLYDFYMLQYAKAGMKVEGKEI